MKLVVPDEASKLIKGSATQQLKNKLPKVERAQVRGWCILLAFVLVVFLVGLMIGNEPYTPPVMEVPAAEAFTFEDDGPARSLPPEVAPQPTVPATLAYPQELVPTVEVQPVDIYAKYDGQPVPHPRRQPDSLIVVKVSRYDPQLGGTNCFRWGQGTCLSNLANGEDWRINYEIAIACPSNFPLRDWENGIPGAIIEIDGKLWECKDRGGKIVQNRPGVYWVDQLSATGHFPFGTEMVASVWFPGG